MLERKDYVMLAIVTVLFADATLHMAELWNYIVSAFTNHGGSPDIVAALSKASVSFVLLSGQGITIMLNNLIADCLIVGLISDTRLI